MPVVWRNTMSKKTKKTEWTKNCPKCNKIITYKSIQGYNGAIKNNSLCRSCSKLGKNNPMFGRDVSDETKSKLRILLGNQSGENNLFYGKHHTEATKHKISKSAKGKTHSDETKLKMSESAKGKLISKSTRDKISKALVGYKHSVEFCKKMRKIRIDTINSRYGQMMPNYNPSSIPIIEAKAKELGITDLQHAENGGEFYIKELGYWVDGYSKEKNIVIEYYEKHHNRQVSQDIKREDEIKKYLGCEFIIIKE